MVVQSSHKQYIDKWEWPCPNKTLFTKIVGQIQSVGISVPTPDLGLTRTGPGTKIHGSKSQFCDFLAV